LQVALEVQAEEGFVVGPQLYAEHATAGDKDTVEKTPSKGVPGLLAPGLPFALASRRESTRAARF